MSEYIEQSQLEHRFWLQILGDHSRFILTNLAPRETGLIARAREFINIFDSLLEQARGEMDSQVWRSFARQVVPHVQSLRLFKLEILKLHLSKKVEIGLSPTFFNHMINELDEYVRNLNYLGEGQLIPPKSPVHHHLLWVLDAEGHAASIYCDLDASQTNLRNTAKCYKDLWSQKYLETVEFAGFLRTGIPMFPSLGEFDETVAGEMFGFKDYLEDLKLKTLSAKAIGTLSPLVPDHMAREECYYLYRLHRSDPKNVPNPNCDFTRPRVQE